MRTARLGLFAIAAITLAGCEVNLNSEGVVSRETKRFDVKGVPEVQLETFDGAIEIHSWDRDQVEIEVEKRAMEQSYLDEMKVSAEQQGNRIVFKISRPPRYETRGIQVGVHFSPTARVRVALPRESQVTASSGDGAITIEDVTGKLSLTTTDGSVRAARLAGEVMVRSGDGAIRMENVAGKLDLETEDGSISLDVRPTVLKARTSDGSIRVQVRSESVMAEDWDLQTADGSVVVTLPTAFNAEIDASSRDGQVRANHPGIAAPRRDGDDRERPRALRATMGSGGRTMRVRTGDGSIRFES